MARTRVARTKRKTVKKAAPNISKMSLTELLALQQVVETAIAEARQRERSEVLVRMEELASKSGFSLSELVGGRGRGKGKVSVAKYANPDDRTQTWTGRGRKPNWLIARLKKGASLEDFSI